VAVLLDGERMRPPVLDRVAEAVDRAHAGIAAPREHEALRAAHADQLVVEDVGRHADELEVLAALANHFVAGGEGDEMREAFHRYRLAVSHETRDRVGERHDLVRHGGTTFWREIAMIDSDAIHLRPRAEENSMDDEKKAGVDRRTFLKSTAAGAAAT